MSKLYVWVNSKLSSLQKGLQSAHVVHELVAEYLLDPDAGQPEREELTNWVRRGKIVVVLEGGSHGELSEMVDFFGEMPEDDDYPFGYFIEDDLNEAITAVGIVLDAEWDRENRDELANLNEWETVLLAKLTRSREAA